MEIGLEHSKHARTNAMPNPPRAIVLSFDRLSRRCLGCYGHEWIETPNLDRLAARAVVFDQHFAEFVEDEVSPKHAWWRGPSSLGGLQHAADSRSLFEALAGSGVETHLLVECLRDDVLQTRTIWPAAELVIGDDDSSEEGRGEDLEVTPLAQLVSRTEQELSDLAGQPQSSWLLWLKSRGIAWPCVATEVFAELYADELDSDDAHSGDGREFDPIKLAEVAYAACVTQLDHLVGRLLTSIDRLFGDDRPLLIITAAIGEPLGESEPLPLSHVTISPLQETWRLRDEIAHVPLLIAHATEVIEGSRRQELVQTIDLAPTLCDWFGLSMPSPAPTSSISKNGRSLLPLLQNKRAEWRKAISLQDCDGNAALRTRNDLLVERDAVNRIQNRDAGGHDNAERSFTQLFLKPEDVWELNDVAEQNLEQIAELHSRWPVGFGEA